MHEYLPGLIAAKILYLSLRHITYKKGVQRDVLFPHGHMNVGAVAIQDLDKLGRPPIISGHVKVSHLMELFHAERMWVRVRLHSQVLSQESRKSPDCHAP